MSRKWLEREGPRWIEAGFITPEQLRDITGLYNDRRGAVQVLPLFGAILFGLGILSFVAANWAAIPSLLRLLLIAGLMTGSYAFGEALLRKGHDKTGLGLISIGWVSFGAGMILIGQMFHLMAYSALSLVLWAAADAALAWLYRSRYLFLLALVSSLIAQFYSASEYGQFSFSVTVLLVVLGAAAWNRREAWMLYLISLSAAVQALIWVEAENFRFLWMYIPLLVLYAGAEWIQHSSLRASVQSGPMTAAFIFAALAVLVGDEGWAYQGSDWLPDPLYFGAAFIPLLVLSFAVKLRFRRLPEAADWIIFVPFIYIADGFELLYTLALFIFSLHLLWRGYAEEWRAKINTGTVLFLTTTLLAYVKLTWDFMDKSLFFMLGGALLLGLGWFLNRKRTKFMHEHKGGERS